MDEASGNFPLTGVPTVAEPDWRTVSNQDMYGISIACRGGVATELKHPGYTRSTLIPSDRLAQEPGLAEDELWEDGNGRL